jgi:PmbA protein
MKKTAEKILNQILEAGFDLAKVSLSEQEQNELSIAHNKVSLMRSTSTETLRLTAIQNNKKVTASISSTEPEAVKSVIEGMVRDVASAPEDPANTVAADQKGNFTKGAQEVDREAMATLVKDFLDYRKENYPSFQVEEGDISHQLDRSIVLSSLNTELELNHGYYTFVIMGSSKDEHGSSSFNYSAGEISELPANIQDQFDIDLMMKNSVQETKTEQLGTKFVGDVILTPNALSDVLMWLQGQLGDFALLQDSSVYKESVGEIIANPMLNIRHILTGAGVKPFDGDGSVLEAFNLIENGKLNTLLPTLYGSRKLELPHRPAGDGWEVLTGETAKEDMIASVKNGALVGRLSMGSPAPNGDFSGVIKNSFLIENGRKTKALSETMISGNVAQMLKDIQAISSDATDFGTVILPWIKIGGLNFS